MVDPVDFLKLIRIGDAPFHRLQKRQLPVYERLATTADVEEDLVQASAQGGLLYRGLDRGAVHSLERIAQLAELIGLGYRYRRDFNLLALSKPDHHPRQALMGELQSAHAQRGDPADQ